MSPGTRSSVIELDDLIKEALPPDFNSNDTPYMLDPKGSSITPDELPAMSINTLSEEDVANNEATDDLDAFFDILRACGEHAEPMASHEEQSRGCEPILKDHTAPKPDMIGGLTNLDSGVNVGADYDADFTVPDFPYLGSELMAWDQNGTWLDIFEPTKSSEGPTLSPAYATDALNFRNEYNITREDTYTTDIPCSTKPKPYHNTSGLSFHSSDQALRSSPTCGTSQAGACHLSLRESSMRDDHTFSSATPLLPGSISGFHQTKSKTAVSEHVVNTNATPTHKLVTKKPEIGGKNNKPSSVPFLGTFGVLDFGRVVEKAAERSKPKKRKNASPEEDAPKRRTKNGEICVRCKQHHLGCNGRYPCGGCMGRVLWQQICVRAKFASQCFGKALYMTRSRVLHDNVERWLPQSIKPLAHVEVSIGLTAKLSLKLNQFVPKQKDYLEHVTFRVNAEGPQIFKATEPYGLFDTIVGHAQLNDFIDELIPELLIEDHLRSRNPLGFTTLQSAYKRSQDSSRTDCTMLLNVLRLWAAQCTFFGHAWRVTKGQESIQAEYWDGLQAYVVPKHLYWQLDVVMEDYMSKLERLVLRDLEVSIFPASRTHQPRKAWFTVYLVAFIYLHTIENETWNLLSWGVKTERWKDDPVISLNPTMVWPLDSTHETYTEESKLQAHAVIGHVKGVSSGKAPFQRSGNLDNLIPSIPDPDADTQAYCASLHTELEAIAQRRLICGAEPFFQEDDAHSLDALFVSKLLLDDSR